MVQSFKPRSSGILGSSEEARQQAEMLDETHEEALPEESPHWGRTPKFARMRFDWGSREERLVIETGRAAVDSRIMKEFADAFSVFSEIYSIIRKQTVSENGDPIFDSLGQPVWERNSDGSFVEDFSALSHRQMRHFIGVITTRLFYWEQITADIWSEAMFAKARFEERFAIAFDNPMSGTVDDRRSAGNRDAAEERYFAIHMTHLSRRADAIVRSADRLSQRLKDLIST